MFRNPYVIVHTPFCTHTPVYLLEATMDLSQHNREFLNKLVIRKELDLDDDSYDCQECYRFWDSEDVLEWFSNKGYTLYGRVAQDNYLPSGTDPQLPYPKFQEYDYPYSCHNAQPVDGGEPSLTGDDTTVGVHFPLANLTSFQHSLLGKNCICTRLSWETRCYQSYSQGKQ